VTRTRLTPRFGEAMSYALFLHGGQERKGSKRPYMGHLLGTAGIVLHFGGDEDEAVGALLHDAAEDQGGRATLDAIQRKFGERVAEVVEGCTDTFDDPKPAWGPRKEAHVGAIRHHPGHVLLVSAADKLDNARAIVADLRALPPAERDAYWSRFNGGRDGSLWYYGALVDAYRSSGDALRAEGVVAELEAAVSEMRALADQRSRPALPQPPGAGVRRAPP